MALVSYDSARSRCRLDYPQGRTVFEGPNEILEARVSPVGREIAFTSTDYRAQLAPDGVAPGRDDDSLRPLAEHHGARLVADRRGGSVHGARKRA